MSAVIPLCQGPHHKIYDDSQLVAEDRAGHWLGDDQLTSYDLQLGGLSSSSSPFYCSSFS